MIGPDERKMEGEEERMKMMNGKLKIKTEDSKDPL